MTSGVLAPGQTYGSITEKISQVVLRRGAPRAWLWGFAVSFALLLVFLFSICGVLAWGVGLWGLDIPVAWGFAIINFVWWIGIGHAGTLISAILLLLHQKWRTSINRFAEAMTLFAVACAGVFPLLHLGRPGLFYWLFPYPNVMGLWPQFRSPLVWDVFAVSTYATVSLLFWFLGLVPDLATMRDAARHPLARALYGFLAMGWRGDARHYRHYETAYVLLAGLAAPLVISVHSVVSLDFAVSILPGWHSCVFPPYFVAGAIFCGLAMVLVLAIPLRAAYRLEAFITDAHIENMAKLMLAAGIFVAYGYVMEFFMAFYSGDPYDRYLATMRAAGPLAWVFWSMIALNILAPQLLWSSRVRASRPAVFAVAVGVNVGMWVERYVIVVISLTRDFMPSAWRAYRPTAWDWGALFGSIGLFTTLLFLFLRLLPAISMSEMRGLLYREEGA